MARAILIFVCVFGLAIAIPGMIMLRDNARRRKELMITLFYGSAASKEIFDLMLGRK